MRGESCLSKAILSQKNPEARIAHGTDLVVGSRGSDSSIRMTLGRSMTVPEGSFTGSCMTVYVIGSKYSSGASAISTSSSPPCTSHWHGSEVLNTVDRCVTKSSPRFKFGHGLLVADYSLILAFLQEVTCNPQLDQ